MTGSLHLIIQYANTDNAARQAEFEYCVRANLANPHVAAVHNLVEPQTVVPAEFRSHPKYSERPLANWLRYSDAFAYAAENLPGEVVALSNLDIFLDAESPWEILDPLLENPIVLALGRHEFDPQKAPWIDPFLAECKLAISQDVWVFRAPFVPPETEFEIGRVGCDNAIADRIHRGGRTPLNWYSLFRVFHFDLARGKNAAQTDAFHKTTHNPAIAVGELFVPGFTSKSGLDLAPELIAKSPHILVKLMAEISDHTAYSLEMTTYIKANL